MKIKVLDATLLAKMFVQGTAMLSSNKEVVNSLNVFPVPDGDTGTNMTMTMSSAIEKITMREFETVAEVSKVVSKGCLMGARGNSGVILSQIFRGFAKGCEDQSTLTVMAFCHALKDAQESAYSAVLKPVEGTILTVIKEIAQKALVIGDQTMFFEDLLTQLIAQGEKTLSETPEHLPVLKQAGVVDAGGKGLLLILNGFYNALIGKEIKFDPSHKEVAQKSFKTEDIVFTYCTEFIIEGDQMDGDGLKAEIEKMGDSMVFVWDDDLIKVHIHTNHPGVALEHALNVGSLKKVKIENMKEQHTEIISHGESFETPAVEEEFGFIGVASGEGFAELLKDLGVDQVIKGGQTMNPSTEDFIHAIKKVNAKNIFIFPNNSNIIMAANQSIEMTDKKVFVIPSKSIPQCITSMVAFREDVSAEENQEYFLQAIGDVSTISITHAVRDTVFDDLKIKEGNYLSVLDGGIVSSGEDMIEVSMDAVQKCQRLFDLVNVYYGSDANISDVKRLEQEIIMQYPDAEVVLYDGGQPIYYVVISLE